MAAKRQVMARFLMRVMFQAGWPDTTTCAYCLGVSLAHGGGAISQHITMRLHSLQGASVRRLVGSRTVRTRIANWFRRR